jgi:hypothetical protein
MGVPGADDIMLNYQSTSFHDALYLRETLGLKRAPEFEAWLQRMQITRCRTPPSTLTQCAAWRHGPSQVAGRMTEKDVTESPWADLRKRDTCAHCAGPRRQQVC